MHWKKKNYKKHLIRNKIVRFIMLKEKCNRLDGAIKNLKIYIKRAERKKKTFTHFHLLRKDCLRLCLTLLTRDYSLVGFLGHFSFISSLFNSLALSHPLSHTLSLSLYLHLPIPSIHLSVCLSSYLPITLISPLLFLYQSKSRWITTPKVIFSSKRLK